MSVEAMRQAISPLQEQIRKLQDQINNYKKTINGLCAACGDQPLYDIFEDAVSGGKFVTRSDEFYGKPLATVVRTILERRAVANLGAASVPELYLVMKEGGYAFEAKNDANAQRGVHIALTKNSSTFHRLPNGDYGLREWYPNIREKSKAKAETILETATIDPDEEVATDEESGETVPAPKVAREAKPMKPR